MEKKKTGVSPVQSGEILDFALNALRENGAFDALPEESLRGEADALRKLLPDHYLPDIYLDLPLQGGTFRGMAAVLDCYDRCYLDFTSGGEYFPGIGIPALNAPENRDELLILRAGISKPEARVIHGEPKETALLGASDDVELLGIPGLESLSRLPLQFLKEPCEGGFRLIVTTGTANAKNRFGQRPYKAELLKVLSDSGCGDEALQALDRAAFNCGVPYWHPQDGYREWVACMDIAAFCFTVRENKLCDCHAVIRISDRSLTYSRHAIKPTQAYQWHITDNCDQRCKHCYLFAEDAKLKCMSTPWDQLMLTLEEITLDAERRHAVPMPAISGGDPILHPDFWRFAEELHKRGMRWMILGNPFHLNDEVCRRLRQLGCFRYQLSMDGLEEFHDSMRKPGSFQATLRGLKYLGDAGIQTQLMATVSKKNLEDVLQLMDLAAEYGATDLSFARYCATSPEKAADYPTPEEYRDFLYRYYRKAKAYQEKGCYTGFKFKEHLFTLVRYELGEFRPSEYSKAHPEMIFDGCHLGQGCSILPNGDLMACRRMESVIGNVKTAHISDILTSELCQSYIDIRNIKKCRDCELGQFCRGCRAVGFNATGDLQGEDPCCWKKV